MYAIERSFNGRVHVIDGTGSVRFRGSMRECEDWLDFRDNNPTDVMSSTACCDNAASRRHLVPSALVWGATAVDFYLLLLSQSF